jgi:hypothetical protein
VKDRSGLRVCSFVVNALHHQIAGRLKLVAATSEQVRRNPNNPERDSDHKDD